MKYIKFEGLENLGQAVSMISQNQLDVALIKNIMIKKDCDTITSNFFNSSKRVKRHDNVPGYILGATHYGKLPKDYFNECSVLSGAIEDIFKNTEDPMHLIYDSIRKATQCVVRPSCYHYQEALHARAVQWLPDDIKKTEFLLLPHEDLSQLDCEMNNGWELRNTKNVLALNFYASVELGEGRLRIYDFMPDEKIRNSLGLQCLGYPYPLKMLHDKSYLDLAVETGDLAVFNGRYIHAVTNTSKNRVVINSFISKMPNSDFLYWT